MKAIYPCTIIADRYSGTYSGALWTAWNCHPTIVPGSVEGSDVYCGGFWNPTQWDIDLDETVNDWKGSHGKGDTPEAALADLVRAVAEKEA